MSAARIGNYEIVRMLARGGMAAVYLVRQPALDREVVLKRLDLETDDPRLAQRFVQEARLAATLNHPNVVTLFDFFEHDGVPYIAMEYVSGGSLRSIIGTLELPQIIGLVEGILAGLGHAERLGIAHRDLKPENVLLTRRGNVKIADFGIARAYTALTQRLTTTGMAIGTPAYMAPEQALNEPLGPYTDLYALGVIVYELLAGRPPFDADTPVGVLYCHVHQRPPPLKEVLPAPQPALCDWVEWLLAKAPSERPQSAAEAWDALEEIAVAELGPYWRRAATISPAGPGETGEPLTAGTAGDDDELPTTAGATTPALDPDRTGGPPVRTPLAVAQVQQGGDPPRAAGRRPAGAVAAVLALVGGASAVAFIASAGDTPPPRAPAAPTRPAMPYDFDGDGRQELVIGLLRGRPRGDPARSGVVLIHRDRAGLPAWSTITESRAGLPGRPRSDDEFGSGVASGDFDADGSADLAVGTPGKERVSVLYGASRGLLAGRTQQLAASAARLPPSAGAYGFLLRARDLNGDRFDDLVVSAPGESLRQPGTGALQILLGGTDGLQAGRSRRIRRPAGDLAGFGTRLRTGDVDGDGRIDLVEGSPARETVAGHVSYCRGSARGPVGCRVLPAPGGTSSLAVGDVNGDRYADIIQGDAVSASPALAVPPLGGVIRVWLGSRRGPRRDPLTISQDTDSIPGTDEPGDEFGAVVDAGDVDSDGFADMVVGAIGENGGAGAITVIRGGRAGYASTGHSWFDQDQPTVPGTARADGEFGSSLTVLNLTADRRLDVAVAAKGDAADARVMVVQGGPGVFAPDETRTRTLPGVERHVLAVRVDRIRMARTAGG